MIWVLLAALAAAALSLDVEPSILPLSPTSVTGPLLFSPEVRIDPGADQGALLRVRARDPEGLDGMNAYLADAQGGSVSRAAAFPAEAGSPSREWAGLIGVPSTMRPGTYRVVVTAARLGRSSFSVLPVTITRRRFAQEDIALGDSLTRLRTDADPRKVEEARELAALLASSRADDLLETGAFCFPVLDARRTAGFGDRRRYRYTDGGLDHAVHNGIDFALPEGAPVAASARGRVVFARERIMSGLSAVVEHLPGVYSLYFHLSRLDVGEGDLVEKGSRIGLVGKTGLATGPHLHWEVQVLGVAVDPELFVRESAFEAPRAAALDKSPQNLPNGRAHAPDIPGEGR